MEKHKNSLQKSENIVKNILTTLVQHSDRWDKLCNEFKSLVNDIPEPISPVINYINFDKDVKNLKEELFELYEADDESLFEKFDDVTNFTSKNIEFYNVLKGNISVVNRIFEKESKIYDFLYKIPNSFRVTLVEDTEEEEFVEENQLKKKVIFNKLYIEHLIFI